MAIYGAGSIWGEEELLNKFFNENIFTVGWCYEDASDLFDIIASVKIGDIIYLKSNAPGSRRIRVKGIGVVTNSLIHYAIDRNINISKMTEGGNLSIEVNWIVQDEFECTIPAEQGKLTSERTVTFYEEHLPFVQRNIISHLFSH